MKTIKKRFRKGTALLLACTMMAGVVTAMPGNIVNVKAATVEPSVTAYATKEQLNGDIFAPDSTGNSNTIAKLVFGKNSSGNPQEWYILGKDSGVSGDNTIIFAASPIIGKVFNSGINNKTYQYGAGTGYGDSEGNIEVFANHYGASDLRVALQRMLMDEDGNTVENYFTVAEQDLMNNTTVKTKDTKNSSVTYTTTDKLYALQGDYNNDQYLLAGSSDSKVLAMNSYWSSPAAAEDSFWLRSPDNDNYRVALAIPGAYINFDFRYNNLERAVRPASNLNLSSVLFASAAKAASSGTESETIALGTAMTLRLSGSSERIGTVKYNTTTGDIKVAKGSTEGNVALVVQGKGTVGGAEKDWYYSKQITGTETVNVSAIVSEANTPDTIDLSTCKIWLETTDTTKNLTYAVEATQILSIASVDIIGFNSPAADTTLDTLASCATIGVSNTTPQITWTPNDSAAGYITSYTASITLTADTGYEFIDSTTATILGNNATSVTKNTDGTMFTITYEFPATAKRKIVSVTVPDAPTKFTSYYNHNGYRDILTNGGNSELGTQAEVTFESSNLLTLPSDKLMNVTWTIENAGGGDYDNTPGASNTFRWTITDTSIVNYDITNCSPGYDNTKDAITGTVTITNKEATPVNIAGTDSSIEYAGADIDVSQYFNIDANAETATYTDITTAGDGMGIGTLNGSLLTVTQTGKFQIKVNTAPNGIYAAGEATITLTVDNGNIQYTMSDYSGNYDGQPHGITLAGLVPDDAIVTYSTDGTTFDAANPAFTNVGTYTVYYSIFKDNYNTSNGSKTITINKKPVTIKADEQKIIYGNVIDQSKYTTDGLATGDSIANVTLSPSTSAITDNGTISVSDVKIVNAAGEDVTGNYDITTVNGTLKIVFDYQIIDGANSSYAAGGGEELSIRGNGDFSKFAGVKVDGNLVDPNYYTAKEGSTIIILKSSYMNTLSAGTHTFEILWTDGSASTTFTINANPADSNSQSNNDSANQNNNSSTNVSLQNNANKKDAVPKTGDTTPVAGLFVLAIISGIGLLVTEKRAKKDC